MLGIQAKPAVTGRFILDHFGCIANLADGRPVAKPADAAGAKTLEWLVARAEAAAKQSDLIERYADRFERFAGELQKRAGNGVFAGPLCVGEPGFPEQLADIPAAPPVIFAAGKRPEFANRNVAVVGTRNPSRYALKACEDICRRIAEAGVTIVSGMALGIDRCAHEAALRTGGHTLAVLGNGFDICSPSSNADIYYGIIEKGAILSDYAPGHEAEKHNFAQRNRIISGLATLTLVVAAGERSGALITAGYASGQGRSVMALCGDIDREDMHGCHELIRSGEAKLATNVADILKEAGFYDGEEEAQKRRTRSAAARKSASAAAAAPKLTPDELAVYQAVARLEKDRAGDLPDVDEIMAATAADGRALEPGRAMAVLAELELKGLLNSFFGKRYETIT